MRSMAVSSVAAMAFMHQGGLVTLDEVGVHP